MSDWQSNYAIGDRIEKKVGGAWLPGTVQSNAPGFGVGGTLDNGAPFLAIVANEIHHLRAAAQGQASPGQSSTKPVKSQKPPK